MKGTQRGRDLRVGKSGEHAVLLARQHFWRPQQLDQDDFEQAGKYRLLAWPHSRCLGVDHGQDAGQSPAIAGTARRNMHHRWQECREKFFIDRVKFELPADDANLARINFAASWFRRCGVRREILAIVDSPVVTRTRGRNASFSDYASPPGSKDHEPMATPRPNARIASTAAPILAAEAPR